jgi:methylmalonyl-CoA epimerase
MKLVLDHIGVAIDDLPAALAFYQDALGLRVDASEDVASQRVRAHFIPTDTTTLELLEATAPDSPIARYISKRGPGLHHITLRVDDLAAALDRLKTLGVRLIDEKPRPGAEGALVAFIHPSAAHGVLVELKQPASTPHHVSAGPLAARFVLGDLELVSLSDGTFRLDGGAMFGVVPKTVWSAKVPADDRNRITLAMRPLLVRGEKTLLIDAGVGDKDSGKFRDIYGVNREPHLDQALAEAGVTPDDIDLVLATHLHFDHAGGFTVRDADGRVRPRFPRARYLVRRGEWEDATHQHERNRASYLVDNYVPLEQAGVLDLIDDDRSIMPGIRVQRTGGHTAHHQLVIIESNGRRAAFPADLMPTTAHVLDTWGMGFDLYPMETLSAKKAFAEEAVSTETLVFFEHDREVPAGFITMVNGRRQVTPAAPISGQ